MQNELDAAREIIAALTAKYRFYAVGDGHSIVKHIKGLVSNSKPNPTRQFVAEGLWFNKMILQAGTPLHALLICPERIYTIEAARLVEQLAERCDQRFTVSEKTFEKISERVKPDGVMSIAYLTLCEVGDVAFDDKSVVLVLDGVEIPGNVGTMIRVADGAGVDAVFICNRKARMTHPKLLQSSMGSVLNIPIVEFASADECYEALASRGFEIYLTDSRAEKSYYEYPYGKRCAFVMGSERYGISRGWYEKNVKLLSIPMFGKCDSLNVGVAATVVCYEASLKNKGYIKR